MVILINFSLFILYFNFAIFEKEHVLKNGQLVLLELAPVDPRSLMQGDYMTLSYAISRNLPEEDKELPLRGYCVVTLDKAGVATKKRLQAHATPLDEGEVLIKYFNKTSWRLNIGAESYFFQEGEGDKFEAAKYGGLRIDKSGTSVLVGLYDEDKKLIE